MKWFVSGGDPADALPTGAPARDGYCRVIKVCFTSLYAYSLFNPATRFVFGGSEVRAWEFAKGLSRKPDFDVSFVVLDHGQPDGEVFSAVTLYKASIYRSYESPPSAGAGSLLGAWWRRLFAAVPGPALEPRLRIGDYGIDDRKLDCYQRIDADVYVVFGNTNVAAEVLAFCKAAGKAFVLFAGSDNDFSSDYTPECGRPLLYGNIGRLCHYAATRADTVIAQSQQQAALCRERFGRDAVVIANPIDLDGASDLGGSARWPGEYGLWVGKSDTVKQPDVLLDLAARFPDHRFIMVLNRSMPEIHDRILADAPQNVEIVERVTYAESGALFQNASVVVNTSRFEGFPNTFLQAGKHGVPVLSYGIDPDGFIVREDCGIVADNDFERLETGLRAITGDRQRWTAFSTNIKRYVTRNHALDDKADELAAVLASAGH